MQEMVDGKTTLCDWEQGRFNPPGSLMCLVEIANKRPEVIREILM
jgi:DNA-binding transcriptional regulator YiaG